MEIGKINDSVVWSNHPAAIVAFVSLIGLASFVRGQVIILGRFRKRSLPFQVTSNK